MASSKTCTSCGKSYGLSTGYHKSSQNPDGYHNQCKDCRSKVADDFKKSVPGFSAKVHSRMGSSSKTRNHPAPNFTTEELSDWFEAQDNFKELWDNWVESGYETDLAPSPDRIDSDLPYTFDNMRVITWAQNNQLGNEERRGDDYEPIEDGEDYDETYDDETYDDDDEKVNFDAIVDDMVEKSLF